jgi:hypothetical protein
MFEKTWSVGFVETKSQKWREERRKVGSFSHHLEAVHRFVYSKDDVGLAGGVGLKEGKEIEAGENGGGELMGEEFDVLGRVEVGAKVEVCEVDGAEEGVVGDDRIEEDDDGRERGDLGGGRAGRGKTVTTRSAANTAVYARRVAALGVEGVLKKSKFLTFLRERKKGANFRRMILMCI